MERLRVAYVNAENPMDRRAWSGIHWYAARAVNEHVGDVSIVGPLDPPIRTAIRAFGRATRTIANVRYPDGHNWLLSRAYAREITKQLSKMGGTDLIVGVSASAELAHLKVHTPIVLCADATFAQMHEYYPQFSNIPSWLLREANAIERHAIQRSSLLVYPSEWAANSAIRDYGADPTRVSVTPFGANLDDIPSRDNALSREAGETCRLLFVGVDWERKGGPIAFDTLRQLAVRGIPSELIVCGCVPPEEFSHPQVKVIPFLDKRDPSQLKRMSELYMSSDFFLLPTSAEAAGIVFAEAAAFGLPPVTSDTGGVAGMVDDKYSGLILPSNASGAEYAKAILSIWSDPIRYHTMVRASRDAFESRLNWDAWGKGVRDSLRLLQLGGQRNAIR